MVNKGPTNAEISAQLELIINSKEFASSDRLKSFLVYVVEETLAGRGEQIKAYNVGVDVFDLGMKFDSALNPSVRVAAGRLRTKLERYYFTSSNDDKVYIEIPRGSYTPVFSCCESSPPFIANPADDCAVYDGDKKDVSGFLSADLAEQSKDLGNSFTRTRQGVPAIVVMPFVAIGEDLDLNNFLYGLTEEIAIALTRFDDILVLDLPPGYALPNDVWRVSERIGARFVITGSAQSSGNDIRLRVNLMDYISRSHVWAEKFDARFDEFDLFNLQDQVTGQVVARIADSFGLINRMLLKEQAKKRTADLEVYEAMLYYHYWLNSLTPQRFIKVKQALERAVEMDPLYATTKAMLSDVYASHCQWGLHIFDNAVERSLELANQALELDMNCQYAYWAKAYNCYLRRDEEYFLDSVYKAIEINPSNTNILATAGMKLAMLGKSDEGLEMLNTALGLNPHIPCWYHSGPFIVRYMEQDYEEALLEAKHITTDNFMWGPLMRAAAYGQLGQLESGRRELENLFAIEPDFKTLGYEAVLKMFFRKESALAVMSGLQKVGFKHD